MPSINDSFSSKYLRASDIGTEGDSAVVTILKIGKETVQNQQGGKEDKPVLFFREYEKGLVLNKTNAKKITALLKSDDTDDWINKQIQLFATETEFGGDTVACIRVKQAAVPTKQQRQKFAPPTTPLAEDASDDDVPF